MSVLNRQVWSPYVAGVVIGLLQVPAFLLVDTALGTSTSYVYVGGHLASLVDPGARAIKYFSSTMDSVKNAWQLGLVVGIAVGAAISARASGMLRRGFSPVWRRALGTTSLTPRVAIAFVGGFVLVFGARIADGCTSGHGLSGLAQLAVSSIVAVGAMFVGGIVTALMMRRI